MHGPVGHPLGEWYAAFTQPGVEFHVLTGLRRLNITAHLPTMISCRKVRGRTVERSSALLPRYLFVCINTVHIAELHSVAGLLGLLPFGRDPEAIPAYEVESLRTRELNGEFVFKPTVSDRRRHKRVLRSLRELACMRQ